MDNSLYDNIQAVIFLSQFRMVDTKKTQKKRTIAGVFSL